jgi:hypothetical protein
VSIRTAPFIVRIIAVLVGLTAALTPAALLAYDAPDTPNGLNAIAQASPTAAPKATTSPTPTAAPKAATPAAAPKTGTAGIAQEGIDAEVAALLIAVTVIIVLGGRALAVRRS